MQKFTTTFVLNILFIMLSLGLLFSCGEESYITNDALAADTALELKSASNADCESDCLTPGSGMFYENSGSASRLSGINTKKVSYVA